MTPVKPSRADARQANSQLSLRVRLVLLIVLTVTTGAGLGILFDYRRERAVHTDVALDTLHEQAESLLLTREALSNAAAFDQYIQQFCARMRDAISPGHHVVLLDPAGRVIVSTCRMETDAFEKALLAVKAPRAVFPYVEHDVAVVRLQDADGSAIIVTKYLDPAEAVLRDELISRAVTAGVVVLSLLALIMLVINAWVLKPLTRLGEAAQAWSSRRFGTRARVTGPPDLRRITAAFNHMAENLEGIERRRTQDMERARVIQHNLLPARIPAVGGLSVAAVYRPAEEVAGDLYDIFELPDGRAAIALLDVSGHGVSAALLTGVVKMSLHHRLAEHADLAEAVRAVNDDLMAVATEGEFVTLVVGAWHVVNRTWTYVAAGHTGGMILRNGGMELLPTRGALLGVKVEGTFESTTVPLHDGDRIILYTDGVTEAGHLSDPLGQAGLTDLLTSSSSQTLKAQVALVADEARKRCSAEQCDDITIVGFEVLPGAQRGDYYVI